MHAVNFHKASAVDVRLLTTIIGLAAIAILSGALSAWLATTPYAAANNQIQAALATSSGLIQSLQPTFAPDPLRGGPSPQVLASKLDEDIRAIALPEGTAEGGKSARLHLSYRRLLSDWQDKIKPGLERFFSHRRIQGAGLDRIDLPQPRVIERSPQLELALSVLGLDLARLDLMLRERASSRWGMFDAVQYAALFLLLITAVLLGRRWITFGRRLPQGKGIDATTIPSIGNQTQRADASRGESPTHAGTSLALLQTVLAGFVDNPESPESFLLLLREIERLIDAKCSAIFMTRDSDAGALPLVCTEPAERVCFVDLLRERMPARGLNDSASIQTFVDPAHPGTHIIAVQLAASDGVKKGVLLVKRQFALPLSSAEKALLSSMGKHLAAVICSTQRAQVNRRLALCEERAVIARELHDSLAQSLSYLKIQTGRLQRLLHSDKGRQEFDTQDADVVLQELRTNLNLAYRQLRELITTFRLTMNGRSLSLALKDSVEEFENRSSVAFTLDNRVPDGLLSVDEEMHILQIVRECVCNVVRHAQAKRAEVLLQTDDTGAVSVTVDDDGVGMNVPRSPDQHHGLAIVQQRAHSLGGDMRVLRSPDGGTRIRVSLATHRPNPSSEQVHRFTDQTQP
jgi:signal transduction histidine kinase